MRAPAYQRELVLSHTRPLYPPLPPRHTINASGVSWNKGVLDPTGAQMVLTLKLISTAMCLQDFHEKTPQVGRLRVFAVRG